MLYRLLIMGMLGVIAQLPFLGKYVSEDGFVFEIKESTAIITFPESHARLNDTVAVCRVFQESPSFLRIDSLSPEEEVFHCMTVEEDIKSDIVSDSVVVMFSFPVNYRKLRILIREENSPDSDLSFVYPDQRQICLPKEKHYLFGVEPCDPFGLFSIYNLHPITELMEVFPIKRKNKDSNFLTISIPCINDGFFEKVWITGDYVKISEKELIWKGIVFKKKDRQNLFGKGLKTRNAGKGDNTEGSPINSEFCKHLY